MFAKRILLALIITGTMATVAGAQSQEGDYPFEVNQATDSGRVSPSGKSMQAKVIKVNCSAGKKIANALSKADPGDTIRVTGTCHERVTIITDRITLDGQGSAILDGGGSQPITAFLGVITVDGARGIAVTGFTIRNGPVGIVAKRGAAIAVSNVTVQENGVGIVVADHSFAELTNVTSQRNQTVGMDVFTSSTAVLKGTINITENAGNGVEVNGNSVLEIRGATVQINNDNEFGLIAASGSQVALFGFDESQGSTLTANGNGVAGIGLGDTTLTVFASNTTISAENNPMGIFLPDGGSISSPFGRGTFLIKNNGIGLNFGQGSGANIVGGLNVQNNGTGLLADAAGILTLVSMPPNPSSITGNTDADVNLRFGTRSTINGVTIGTITCDGTVLSRGTIVCP
ncbi:MAG: hypothetical protein M3R15_08970 [Acidobacteriota bacterium]|nr:hypothetical protein [Acidobacteriota bacterium]